MKRYQWEKDQMQHMKVSKRGVWHIEGYGGALGGWGNTNSSSCSHCTKGSYRISDSQKRP